jgi:transcriptional regulator with XRE-family HTH domain
MKNTHLKIRFVREQKNLTQSFIAEKINVSNKTYLSIEAGRSPITIERLQDIALALDVTLDYLLEEGEVAPDTITPTLSSIQNHIKDLESRIQHLEADKKTHEAATDPLWKEIEGSAD